MPALWKQDQELHPTFGKINRCLGEDWFLLPCELKLQRAHARTLRAAGILSADECVRISAALDQIDGDFARSECPPSKAEDVHTWVEAELTRRVGEPGRKIHTARSRNDQVATLLKMYLIETAGRLGEDLRGFVALACRRAETWSDLVFPLQTHAQFAAPGNVGFWVLRYAVAVDRVRTRLAACASQWRQYCPLGSGAAAGSSIPIDRRIQAAELGFEAPSLNALDSTSSRDECLEFLALAVALALHLQSFAADVIGFAQTAHGWVIYPPAFGTGSSMMPNKRNPDAMELLRGEANQLLAAHHHAVLILKGLPAGYNRDLQCIKPVVRSSAEKLRELTELAVAFLEQLEFDPAALAASLTCGDIGATRRMEQDVLAGVPLREAHHRVADEGPGAVKAGPVDCDAYRTLGGANPEETRRVAGELLASLEARPAT